MGVTSIRLNKKEEKLLNYLKEHYNCDTSTLLKKTLYEMYEDIKDKESIDDFEKRHEEGKTFFSTFDELFE